jgi:hypothetical protein
MTHELVESEKIDENEEFLSSTTTFSEEGC